MAKKKDVAGKTKSKNKKPINMKNTVSSAVLSNRNETVSIRKISNGYIVRREYMKKDEYVTKESFSKKRPIVRINTV